MPENLFKIALLFLKRKYCKVISYSKIEKSRTYILFPSASITQILFLIFCTLPDIFILWQGNLSNIFIKFYLNYLITVF